MNGSLFGWIGSIALLTLAGAAFADETVENPEYKKWAAWKEGAYATLKGENRFGDMVTVVTTTQKLKTVAADKVVIEYTTITETNGQTIKAPPFSMDVLASEPKLSAAVRKQLDEQAQSIAAKFKQSKGQETLTINGKKLDCEWVRTEGENNDSKGWTCADVPGQTVQLQSLIGPLKSNVQLIDWKGEKK